MVFQDYLIINTKGKGFYDITAEVANCASKTSIRVGICQIFIHHTSASLIVTENADPSVKRDLEAFMSALVKEGDPLFLHTAEGDDDMPAHVRCALTQTSLSLPVAQGQLVLGEWQGIYVWEHRYKNYQRRLTITIIGDEL